MRLQDYEIDTLERAEQAASFLLGRFQDQMPQALAVNLDMWRVDVMDLLKERSAARDKARRS
jgi:hypothetical protein